MWVLATFKIEIQKEVQRNSAVLQNWFPQKVGSPLIVLQKFQNPERSTAEC